MFINQKNIKFLIFVFCFSIFSTISQTNPDIPFNNMAINETPKPISPIIFEDFSGNKINIKDYKGKLLLINFWATWCAPCKKEMTSLDSLFQNRDFNNLEVLAVNMEKPNRSKTEKFFNDLNIKKIKIFFDSNLNFLKELKLRGVPTTVLINKKGEEFARIIGEVNFQDKKFLNWLKKYD
tara:strand:+ start:312 stop:851 length:540 start_codon:yes stop_codon:yes gene_type:complete